jgi:hypothetical protein
MKIGSFDIDTAKEMIGNEEVIRLEALAAADLEKGVVSNFTDTGSTYWDQCRSEFKRRVYESAYEMKKQKQDRISEKFEDDPELLKILATVVVAQAKAFAEYKAGKEKAIGAIVGQVLKIKKFDPKQIKQAIDKMEAS